MTSTRNDAYAWRGMHSAPKDGTWVLLLLPDYMQAPGVFVAQWVTFEDGTEEWSEYHEYNLEADPIKWAPLPEVV